MSGQRPWPRESWSTWPRYLWLLGLALGFRGLRVQGSGFRTIQGQGLDFEFSRVRFGYMIDFVGGLRQLKLSGLEFRMVLFACRPSNCNGGNTRHFTQISYRSSMHANADHAQVPDTRSSTHLATFPGKLCQALTSGLSRSQVQCNLHGTSTLYRNLRLAPQSPL